MNYPTFEDKYGQAAQQLPNTPAAPGAAGMSVQDPNMVPPNPWSKALDPWAFEAEQQNPPMVGTSGKV